MAHGAVQTNKLGTVSGDTHAASLTGSESVTQHSNVGGTQAIAGFGSATISSITFTPNANTKQIALHFPCGSSLNGEAVTMVIKRGATTLATLSGDTAANWQEILVVDTGFTTGVSTTWNGVFTDNLGNPQTVNGMIVGDETLDSHAASLTGVSGACA